jgi:hypothetical protein
VGHRVAFRGFAVAVALDLALAAVLVAPVAARMAAASASMDASVRSALATKGQTTAWVVLKAHADLSPAFAIKDWNARGRFVYERLKSTAESSQAALQAFLRNRGASFQSFWIANAIKVSADAATFDAAAARPEVDKIIADKTYAISPVSPGVTQAAINTVEWGVDRIKAPQVWSTFGDHGEGIVVATIDTGVLYTHPALVGKYRGNLGGGNFSHDYNWWDPSLTCGSPMAAPCDNNGHGTHTMGTIVGDDGSGNQVGVAPGAKWIAAKGCESSSCSSASLLSSGQFMVAPTKLDGTGANAAKRPQLVSNSWGDGPTDTFYQATVQAWLASGIFPVFANGNSGPGCQTAGTPGAYPESYAVGAFDINNVIASFSSRGASQVSGGGIKPNISAPGVNVRSSWNDGSYNTISGTSMATPHVAGAVALVLSANPALIGDINGVRAYLDQTAIDVSDLTCGGTAADNNVWGEGRMDAFAAVTLAAGPHGTLTGVVRNANTSAVIPNADVSVTGSASRSTTTDASGIYSMVLPAGTYDVTGSKFGFSSSTVNGAVVPDGGTKTQDLSLAPVPTRTVSGHVRDASSAAVAGVPVTVLGTPLPSATTDGAGFYSIPGVPDGSYSARADAPSGNRCLSSATNALNVSGSNVVNFDFTLPHKHDTFGYRCRVEASSFVDGTTQLTLTGDDVVQNVVLPFTFTYYGTGYSSVNVSTNGNLQFTGTDATWVNGAIPTPGSPNNAIYPYFDDDYVDTVAPPGTGVYTASLGVAPNRQFVIEWRNIRYFDYSGRVGFEVILNENGDVQTNYKDILAGDGREMGNSATVGIENAAGTDGIQYAYNEGVLSTGLSVRYYIPSAGPNQPPVANNDSDTTNENTPKVINVLLNDSDPDFDPLGVRQVDISAPAHGTASVNADFTITYTPAANYSGPDSFTYRAWDGALTSNAASVSVTVNHVNQAPTVSVDAASVGWSCSPTTASGTVSLTAFDPDGDPLTWTATSSSASVLPNAGLVLGAPGSTRSLTATGSGSKGSSTITVTVADGSLSGSATLSLRVGGNGKDTMNGGSGPDMFFGMAGNDKLNGNGGNDLLCGGPGNDSLTGGAGADYFSGAAGTDVNTDFAGLPDISDGT